MVLLLLATTAMLLIGSGLILGLAHLFRGASTRAKLEALKGAAAGAAAGAVAATLIVVATAAGTPELSPAQVRQVEQLTQEADGPVEVIVVHNEKLAEHALEIADEEGFEVVEWAPVAGRDEDDLRRRVVLLQATPDVEPTKPDFEEDSSGMTAAMDW